MANYTTNEWTKIRAELNKNPAKYGLPARTAGSVLLASFNIRKLGGLKTRGKETRSKETWQFLAHILERFDLIAVQEVMNNLDGLRHLKDLLGDDYGLITSDVTGAFHTDDNDEEGMAERLAFLYNRTVVERAEIATDVSADRTQVLSILYSDRERFWETFQRFKQATDVYEQQRKEHKEGRRPKKPTKPALGPLPQFLDYIRTPFQVGFRINPGKASKGKPYEFVAVNAHLNYGSYMEDRWQDFDALLSWLLGHAQDKNAYYPDCILLGDLNLDFNDPETDRVRIEQSMKGYDKAAEEGVRVNFPFLDPHKGQATCYRTNARLTETFDQIGLFFQDKRWPTHDKNAAMPLGPDGPDYGVFDFVNLFANVLNGKPYSPTWTPAEKKAFFARFEFEVSDHMPLWMRLPKP